VAWTSTTGVQWRHTRRSEARDVNLDDGRVGGVDLDSGRVAEVHAEEERGTDVEAVGAASSRTRRRSERTDRCVAEK
jgi:hypothetical protein